MTLVVDGSIAGVGLLVLVLEDLQWSDLSTVEALTYLAQRSPPARLLVLGTSVVLEWGFWARSERDEKREAARALGVAVELRFLDAPYDELVRRVVARHAVGGVLGERAEVAEGV